MQDSFTDALNRAHITCWAQGNTKRFQWDGELLLDIYEVRFNNSFLCIREN